jgi:nicotinamidase/pyrazinamidase
MSFDLLLVLCPQNSFLDVNGSVYMGEAAEVLKIRLQDYIGTFPGLKVFIREKRIMEDRFFLADKTHSIVNTEDFQMHESLRKYAELVYDKTRYSALYGTQLEVYLKQKNVKGIGIVGLETHTSVLFTAEDLRNRGYDITIVEPCVMARDEYMHGFAISLMRNVLGVKISS